MTDYRWLTRDPRAAVVCLTLSMIVGFGYELGVMRAQGAARPPERLGEVVASILTEAQFQTVYGAGWVLADGRDVSGTAYHTLSGQRNVPDLHGRVLAGVDESGQTLKDATKLRSVGGSQSFTISIEQMPKHNHEVSAPHGACANCQNTQIGQGGLGIEYDNTKFYSGYAGEGNPVVFAPPFVAVNFFIKVDGR